MIDAICFPGNPGPEYRKTRHNAGWLFSDHWYISRDADWKSKFKGQYASVFCADRKLHLLKPDTYMNKSGESAQSMLAFFQILPESLLVVHDDIEQSFGQVNIKQGGGLAGHNGLKSIAQQLGTREFYRLRIGVSRPVHGSVSSHVLGKFSEMEQAELPGILEKAGRMLDEWLR